MMASPPKIRTTAPKKIASVREFIGFVTNWKIDDQVPLAFRGQRARHWRPLPTLLRPGIDFNRHEKDMVRDLVSMHPSEFANDRTMFERLVRMQHFNLPTRLLDVTSNPLVALWFAAEPAKAEDGGQDGAIMGYWVPPYRKKHYDSDVVTCLANLANLTKDEKDSVSGYATDNVTSFNRRATVRRLLHFIRQEKSDFSPKIEPDDLFRPVYVRPKLANRRILAQNGAFLIYGLDTSVPVYEKDLRSRKVVIPEASKAEIRLHLSRLGITASALFPEIDKAAEFLKETYSAV